ncbi:hypothetical protein MAFF301069_01850 [Ralstonia pseudosolanacearum]|nr:hypothetical protein MAFF241647_01400 [Ralstonia solanacearum]BEU65630.1 hypothetical protein MAFF301069_01850 [Ralstonia pseudosolanacearum]
MHKSSLDIGVAHKKVRNISLDRVSRRRRAAYTRVAAHRVCTRVANRRSVASARCTKGRPFKRYRTATFRCYGKRVRSARLKVCTSSTSTATDSGGVNCEMP